VDQIGVMVIARDPVLEAGLASQLRGRREVVLVEVDERDLATVALVAADSFGEDTCRTVRAVQRNGCPRVILVLGRLDESCLLAAVESGACGMLRRSEINPERLVNAISSAARGDGTLPPDLLGRLIEEVGRIQRETSRGGGMFNSLNDREVEVLKLFAVGCDTAEVADTLMYSERTVKNILHSITSRFQLRNRTHAVAYAVREGFI
jgi:DNA-binding NarL/FixJ family response regulator